MANLSPSGLPDLSAEVEEAEAATAATKDENDEAKEVAEGAVDEELLRPCRHFRPRTCRSAGGSS